MYILTTWKNQPTAIANTNNITHNMLNLAHDSRGRAKSVAIHGRRFSMVSFFFGTSDIALPRGKNTAILR